MNVFGNDIFITECINQAKIKKLIKWPIVSICVERKTIFFNSVGSDNSLEKNNSIAALIMSIKKVR